MQVPDLAGLVAGGSEDLGAIGMPAAGEDGCAVRLLCLHTGLASLIELPAADLEWVGHGKGCKQGDELGSQVTSSLLVELVKSAPPSAQIPRHLWQQYQLLLHSVDLSGYG